MFSKSVLLFGEKKQQQLTLYDKFCCINIYKYLRFFAYLEYNMEYKIYLTVIQDYDTVT
jgi:hypothetical protein